MDEVLLTPAGIADALGKLLPLDQDMLYNCHKVSQAQHTKSYEAGKKETKRETLDWLDGRCDLSGSIRWSCQHCREALRREVA